MCQPPEEKKRRKSGNPREDRRPKEGRENAMVDVIMKQFLR